MRCMGSFLRQLELHCANCAQAARWASMCPHLVGFYSSVSNLQLLLPLWHRLPHLERLVLLATDPISWSATLENLARHCRKLTHIKLFDPKACSAMTPDHVVSFLASYGSQLLCAFLGKLPPRLCANLVACCRNVQVSYVESLLDFFSIAVFGDHLDSLVFDDLDEQKSAIDYHELSAAMSSCRHLSSLEGSASPRSLLPLKVVQTIFTAPMRNVRNLSLPAIDKPLRVCNLIAAQTQSLRSLTVSFYALADADWLSAVVQTNPHLQSLSVSEMHRHASHKTSDDTRVLLAKA